MNYLKLITFSSFLKTRRLLFFTLLMAICVFGCSKSPATSTGTEEDPPEAWEIPGWELVWQDEFDTGQIDLAKWEFEVNGAGGGNNELQYYTDRPENAYIQDSVLVLKANRESYTGPDGSRDYTSARLRTKFRGDWLYGRFDIRAKLPTGQGIWPAIWMLPTDFEYGGWAASGEIDIMELVGHRPHEIFGTLHYGGEWPNNVHSGTTYALPSGTFNDNFHTFTVEWEAGEFRWYVDGVHYQTKTQWFSTNGSFPAPFDRRFHMLLNIAVGGNLPGPPDQTTIFPQTMEIDFVRVYKAESATLSADTEQKNQN